MRYTLAVTSRRPWSTATALALGVLLLLDVLRVWLPSVTIVYGDRGAASAVRLGLFTVLWPALGLLVVPLLGRLSPRLLAVTAAAGLGATRIALQGTNGGSAQLYLASIGVTAAVAWLVAMAATTVAGRPVAAGITAGVAGSVTVHVALRTVDLMWWTGAGPWLVLVATGIGLTAATWAATDTAAREAAAPGLWFSVGPALLVVGAVTGSPARAEAAAGWAQYRAPFLLLIACCLGVLGCLRARAWTRSPLLASAGLLLLITGATLPKVSLGGVTGLLPAWSVWSQAGAALGLATCLGWAGEGERVSPPGRRALAAAAGMLAFLVLVFGYLTAYDVSTDLPNVWLPQIAAVLVCAGTLAGAGSAHNWAAARGRARHRQEEFGVVAATCLALITALVTVAISIGPSAGRVPATYPIRLVTYDVGMGYDPLGRFNPSNLGRTIRAQRPDVVLLNDADRGWLPNGGHDVLQLLAEYLGMRYVFAPAANEVWGDAMLSRFPIRSVRSVLVSEPGSPVGATALAAVLGLGSGQEIGVVATHLRPDGGAVPLTEVERLRAVAAGLARPERPVVLAGNLNAEPGSPQLAALGPDLADALAKGRPLPTYPSERPSKQVDHVFVTPNLIASDVTVPASTDSDHRPVAVTLAPRG